MNASKHPAREESSNNTPSRLTRWLVMLVVAVIGIGLLLFGVSIASQTVTGAMEHAGRGEWEQAAGSAFYGLLFGGGFLCLVWRMAAALWEGQNEADLKSARPEEPWFWRSDWRKFRISNRHDTLEVVGSIWAVALALAFVGLIFLEVMRWPSQGGWERLGAVAWFVLHSFIFYSLADVVWLPALRRLRFGASTLTLRHPGGPDLRKLEAAVRVASPGSSRMEFRVTLRAFERMQQPGAEGYAIFEQEVFSRSLTHSCHGKGSSLEIPIVFDLPADCGSTSSFEINTVGRVWKLEVLATRPCFDYRAEFEVPVFQCANSSAATASQHN